MPAPAPRSGGGGGIGVDGGGLVGSSSLRIMRVRLACVVKAAVCADTYYDSCVYRKSNDAAGSAGRGWLATRWLLAS